MLSINSGDTPMQLEFLGHAGFIVAHGKIRVACDPWLSPLGAFHASWFQYPCNHHLWDRDYRDLAAVVITNERQDHLDAGFLSGKLSPETPIVVPRSPSRSLWNTVRQACANPIIEVKPGTEHSFGEGLRLVFTTNETADSRFAAATFRTREAVLLNMNRLRLKPKQRDVLKARTGGRIDALLIQGAAPDWNPLRCRHSDERMSALSLVKRVEQLEYAYQALDQMPPRVACPFAGPPAFLEDPLFRYNDDAGGKGLLPDQKRAHDWLRQRGYQRRIEIPLPGDRVNLMSGEFTPDQAMRQQFSFEEKDAYLQAYAERMRPAITAHVNGLPRPTEDLFEPFRAYVRRLGEMNDAVQSDLKLEIRFLVEGPHGGDFLVRCDAGELTVEHTNSLPEEEHPAPCTVSLDAVWLNQIVHHHLTWDDLFQSLRFSVEQSTGSDDDHLAAWLKLADLRNVAEPAPAR
jgi:UDP-MurNAc hydroxylase